VNRERERERERAIPPEVGGFSFGGEAFYWHCSYALKLCNAAAAAESRCDEDWGFLAAAGHYCRRRAALISSQGREEAPPKGGRRHPGEGFTVSFAVDDG